MKQTDLATTSVVEASGGYGECVSDPAELPAALQRALHALLNVQTDIIHTRAS